MSKTIKNVPYSNFKLYHPDGSLMCYCSKKRANWYLNRDLANLKNTDEVHLKFVPNGYGDPDEILEPRQNVCVVSGDTIDLSKHHVVPTQYRKYFDLKYKDKNSCDIVLLTRTIHNDYEKEADKLKMQLENDYGDETSMEYDRHWNECSSIYFILKNHFTDLPPSKQIYFKLRYDGLIDKYKFDEESFNSKTSNYLFINNKLVVDKIKTEYLIIIWKLHFLKYTKTKYLPDWWKPNMIKIIKLQNADIVYYDLNDKELVKLLKRYDLYDFSRAYI